MTAGRNRRLWIFDFDGTLSPIVPRRNAAFLHPACRALLRDLSRDPGGFVAVLSSRALSDLIFRVPVPKIILGGGSGAEWQLPYGQRVGMAAAGTERAEAARRSLLPLLAEFPRIPGVEVEDKYWSVAIHYRGVTPSDKQAVETLLKRLESMSDIRMLSGSCVQDIQVLYEHDKSLGVERLCRILRYDPTRGGILYAGDDENDAIAMRWVIARKGAAVSVGGRARVPGALHVADPVGLARAVRRLAGIVDGPAGGDGSGVP